MQTEKKSIKNIQMECISCKAEVISKFCSNCGEKSEVKKITFRSITEGALSTITNMDRGFLYNVKMLFVDPKTFTNDYVQGKRKGILNPSSFLILAVSLYLIMESMLRVPNVNLGEQNIPQGSISKAAYNTGKFIHTNFKYFWILSVIPLAMCTKLFFRKYNFVEHIAISAFILGQVTLVGLICHILLKWQMVINPLVYLLILWLIYRIFQTKKGKLDAFFMSFGVMLIFVLLLLLESMLIGFIAV